MKHVAQLDVISYVRLQPRNAISAQHEPDFQGAEASPKGDLPVTVVRDEARGGEVVAEEGWRYGEGGGEGCAVADEETAE